MHMIIGMIVILSGVVGAILASYVIDRLIKRVEQEEQPDNKTTTKYFTIKNVSISIIVLTAGILFYVWRTHAGQLMITRKDVLYILCMMILLVVAVVDWNTYEIPRGLNVCILVLGLIRLGLDYHNWSQYIIGFFAVSGFLCLLYWVSGGTWIGGGDVKLMAAAGLLLGWKEILVALVAGCVLGSFIHIMSMILYNKDQTLAFGPYLSLGIVVAMIWGEQLASWYLSLLKI